ncbi:ParB/RepB/Spo0J family partition protein [Legionella sp. MW5194]|uniref:ParB/RepB/Spo0J family partition protein n=1 Tax=Legionella sp. MW5194 TaxID=2662448 RepID=UPI00193CE91F|nr:ParB/RepB/Spo0J family partition protein [Legionella sp. MW5194]
MKGFCLSATLHEKLHKVEQECHLDEKIVSLHCDLLDTWEFRDRKGFELGDIAALANSIRSKGQSQPIVVVKASEEFKPRNNSGAHYVVIAGYRRWLACKTHHLPVEAVIKTLSFDEAIACLVSENEKEDVSDYSKGFFYAGILKTERMTQDILAEKLGISSSRLSQYLAFSQIPDTLWQAIGDISKVSARTAAAIRSILHHGESHREALYRLAPLIARGCGEKRLREEVEMLVLKNMKASNDPYQVIFNNKTLMTIRRGQIHFDKSIVNQPDFPEFCKKIETELLHFVKGRLSASPASGQKIRRDAGPSS